MRVTVTEADPKMERAEVSGDKVISTGIVGSAVMLNVVKDDRFW